MNAYRVLFYFAKATFIKVNVDEREDIAREYGIMTIPMLILFENGTEKKRQSGFMNSDELETFIKN